MRRKAVRSQRPTTMLCPGAGVFVTAVLVLAIGCPAAQRRQPPASSVPVDLPKGSFVGGSPAGLLPPEVVNRRDFIYALAFGPDGTLAFTHHVTSQMELSVVAMAPLRPRYQRAINPAEFDLEDVVLVPAGAARGAAVVPSRQGVVRMLDPQTGASRHEHAVGVPLIRAAAMPSGELIAVGAADGRVLVLDAATLQLRGQARVHSDEVHGLAFLPDGRLVSASFDKTLAVSRIAAASTTQAPAEVRIPSSRAASGEALIEAQVEAQVDGTSAIRTTWLPRQSASVITAAAVKRLGLPPAADGAPLAVQTAQGPVDLPAVELGSIHILPLDLGSARAAVCDACVPAGAELALAGDVLTRAIFLDDVARGEVVIRQAPGADALRFAPQALALELFMTVPLPGPATDLDVSRDGAVAVSFSHERAVRSVDVYQAEKRGDYPAVSPASGAVLVDLQAGALGRAFHAHRGFTTTVALSPDARTLVTGGWDKRVVVFDARTGMEVAAREVAWLVRRARISPDGRTLGVAAWTPVNALDRGDSEPALLLYPLELQELDDTRAVR